MKLIHLGRHALQSLSRCTVTGQAPTYDGRGSVQTDVAGSIAAYWVRKLGVPQFG